MTGPAPGPGPVRAEAREEYTAAELRGEIRHWRRGRAEQHWGQAVSDAYVAVLSTLLVGAMAISALDTVRQITDVSCTDDCQRVRLFLPWLGVLAVTWAALSASRLLGPVFVPPAAGPWLLSAPVDRGAALRPALARALAVAAALSTTLLVGPAIVAAPDPVTGAALVATGACAAVAATAWSAVSQSRGGRWPRALDRVGSVVAVLVWVGLLVAAFHTDRLTDRPADPELAGAAVLVLLVAAGTGARTARRLAGRTPRHRLALTEGAWPSLSGALASFDLPLLHDVLQSRKWTLVGHVRPVRGGPAGWWALPWAEVRRARRNPRPWLVLLAAPAVPFALVAAGTERGALVATALVGFLLGPSLATGLRVVVRTPTLARTYPFTTPAVRGAHVLLPGLGLLLLGLAAGLAVRGHETPAHALALGLATGCSALAATVRWVASPPPNYSAPLLATPAGGLPPGMVVGFVKGFDVWVLTSLPLLLGPGWWAASIAVSLGVVAQRLAERRPLTK